VAAVPWWEPCRNSIAWEPETVNRKGLHGSGDKKLRSLTTHRREGSEASPPLKNWRLGFERAVLSFRNALETQNRCLEALPPVEYLGTLN
jgi:hypothetical protein